MKGGYKLRNQKLDLCNFAKIGTCICTETAFYQFWWLTATLPPATMQPPNKSSVKWRREQTVKQEYIQAITELIAKCQDIGLLDLILTLLRKSIEQP